MEKETRVPEIESRLDDILVLMLDACREFLGFLVSDGWQNQFYSVVKTAIKGEHRDKYIDTYDVMRDKGYQNYSIADMDITMVYLFICFSGIVKVSKATKIALKNVKNDKNSLGSHRNHNEPPEELCLRAILALYNLRDFVRAVDNNEKDSINDSILSDYRIKYVAAIKKYVIELDDERIRLIEKRKEVEQRIQTVINSEKPESEWNTVIGLYLLEAKVKHDFEDFNRFVVSASDSEIPYAHTYAANYFFITKDYSEFLRRLLKELKSEIAIPEGKIKDVIKQINNLIKSGRIKVDENNVVQIKNALFEHGFIITCDENNLLVYSKPKQ